MGVKTDTELYADWNGNLGNFSISRQRNQPCSEAEVVLFQVKCASSHSNEDFVSNSPKKDGYEFRHSQSSGPIRLKKKGF